MRAALEVATICLVDPWIGTRRAWPGGSTPRTDRCVRRDDAPTTICAMTTTRIERHIRASPGVVYAALLDADAIRRWMVPEGMTSQIHVFEPYVGGTFRISLTYNEPTTAGKSSPHTDTFSGRFERLLEDAEVVQSVEFETQDEAMMGIQTITYTLTPDTDGTKLVGLHENLPSGLRPADNELGWSTSIDKLAILVESAD